MKGADPSSRTGLIAALCFTLIRASFVAGLQADANVQESLPAKSNQTFMAEDQQKNTSTEDAVTDAADAVTEITTAVAEEATEAVVAASAEDASPAEAETEATPDPVAESEAAPESSVAPEEEPATEELTVTEAEAEAVEPVAEASEEEAASAPSEEEMEEPVSESSAPPAPEPVPAEPEANVVGYTGEITGRVVKLEDLENIPDEEEDVASFEQLTALIEQTLTDVSEHEIVKGRVVSVGEKEVVIDFGFKSDGVVAKNEFGRELEPGEEVEIYLERIEDYHGQPVISKVKADKYRRWERVETAFNNEEVLEGLIVRRIKGGMIVELLEGLEAFLPGSQIDVRPVRDFDAYLEKRMEFKIVKINPTNENVVVSHKALIEKELESQRESILSTMEAGQVLEGTVKNITDFGVFIDLGGVDGLLHITDLSWGRVSHPSELVELDEKLTVVVLDYDKERQRISLGLKQLQAHPWENISERFVEAQVVEGKVVSITDYGAFVELEKGIEGLVHISEMSWTDHIRHPSQKVSLGQLVEVKILNIDHEGKKISLGMKQLESNPWQGLAERYPPGTVLRGKVRNITNFGVFVEIETGIDGLVHISDLSWTKKVKHPNEVVKKGLELDVVILDIDEDRQRISLGHKQIQTNPWNDFANVYAEGADTKAKVESVEDKGVVVELPLEVEGFIPAGELKHSASFQNAYRRGDELTLRVIRFDLNNKEIILSETAKDRAAEDARRAEEQQERRVERERERRSVQDYQRSAAATGPTTLGELSGLEDLKRQMEAAEADAAEAAEAEVAEAEVAEAEVVEAEVAEAEVVEAEVAEAEVVEEATAEDVTAEVEATEEEVEASAATATDEVVSEDTTAEEVAPEAETPEEAEVAEATAEVEVEAEVPTEEEEKEKA